MAIKFIIISSALLLFPGYIGPGIGGGIIAAILGIIGSFFIALFGILYYPIKRALKRRKKK